MPTPRTLPAGEPARRRRLGIPTPHPGEAAGLPGDHRPPDIQSDRLVAVECTGRTFRWRRRAQGQRHADRHGGLGTGAVQ
ncbi:MAG: hypothetical protein U5P41_14585 [Gammaproteobacteria bacterium]|nr:hypothetical protein [Gammaproteobacteria bacterium]